MTLADKDPALAFAEKERTRTEKFFDWDGAEEVILRKWAQRDPLGALGRVGRVEGESKKLVLQEWARINPAEALAYIKSQKSSQGAEGAGEDTSGLETMGAWILPSLLASDPGAAAEVIKLTKSHGLTTSAREWVAHDAQGALAWARSQPRDDPFAVQVLLKGAQKIASNSPEESIRILSSLPDFGSSIDAPFASFEEQNARREAFAALAAADPEKARKLLSSDKSLAGPGAMDGYLTFAYADNEAGAISQCREWLAGSELKGGVYGSILMAFRWGHGAGARDPSAVLAAIPELTNRVDSEVLSGWAKTNPVGAAEFIAQRAAAGKPVKDLAAQGVLAEIAIAQPEWTSSWIAGLPDTALQHEAAGTLAANWAAFDPDGAAGWLASLPEGALRAAAEAGFARKNADRKNEAKPDPFMIEN